MRRFTALLILLCCAATSGTLPARAQVPEPDGISRLLSALESALASGRVDRFRALTSSALPADDARAFERSAFRDHQTAAAVRERDRLRTPDATRVLVEMLIDRSGHGLLATWQIDVRPAPSSTDPGRYEIAGLQQIAGIDGLYRLALDTSQEFRVTNLTFTATDFSLTMPSGFAFRASTDEGVTALVLRGAAEARFRPSDEAERGQLALFTHKPELVTTLETAFIRLSPEEFTTRLSEGSLSPVPAVADHAARAVAVFDERGARAYSIGLGDLSSARWSINPPVGDVLVEMQTGKYGWLSYGRVANDPEDVSLFDRQAHKNISIYASTERRRSRGRFYSEDDDAKFDVEHVDLDMHLDPAGSTAYGRATLRMRILRDGVNSLQLRLADSLVVQSVTSEQLGRLLSLRTISQNGLIVSLPVPLARGSELAVTIVYGGGLKPQPLDREAITVDRAGQDPQSDALATPEPVFAYSERVHWYPQPATSDFATARLTLHVPSRFQVVATGSAVTPSPAVSPLDAERTVQFVADRPVRYLACVLARLTPVGRASAAVTALAFPTAPELSDSAVSQLAAPAVAVEGVAQARDVQDARPFAARAAAIVTFFTSIVGEAPYPAFTVAGVDGMFPGGHSPPYFTVLNLPMAPMLASWRDDPVAFDDVPWFFLAHETAHQWWGQAVGGKNYHEQWLSEGLAQYFALRYVAATRGADAARDVLSRMRDTALANTKAGPIYLGYRLGHVDNNVRAFRAVLYNKSAVVLDMLRQLIGADAFDAGLRRYYHDQRFSKAGTQDLQFAFEIESQRQLGRFFDQWIMGATIPKLHVTTRIESSGEAAVVHVDQSGEVFDVPVTVLVTYENGQTEPVVCGISQASQDVRVAAGAKGKIRRVRVDESLTLAEFVR